jgi:large subunit ribosomal protein L25
MTQETISLTLEPRDVTGKAVKHLRKDGTVPAVIHDHGKDSVIVQGDSMQMTKIWHKAGKHHPIKLKAGDKNFTALIKSADFDPKKHQLRHVVFNAVNANEKVEAEVPIHAQYAEGNESSPAERNGLLVLSQLDAVAVEAVPSKLPDVLYYDAEKLVEIGDSATVADLVVPEGVTIKIDEHHAVATVFEPSALAAANEAAGGDAEPEDAASVETEEGQPDDESGQAPESMPGGHEQKEPKPSSVEAAKEDKKEE